MTGRYVVTGTSMIVEADNEEQAISRSQDQSGWHWEAKKAGSTSDAEKRMELITLRQSDDPVKIDLEVICGRCTGVICDAEHDDTLDVLVRTAERHLAGCEGFPCKHCGHEVFHVENEGWVAPDAGTDREFGDGVWRDVCPDHDNGEMNPPHEPTIPKEG